MSTEIGILIVDDDDIIRESLATVLSARGFECTQAANGHAALEQLKQREFDVVITDIEMPEMNGIQLLESANQLFANTAFIFITAHASVHTAIEALRKGAYDYLLKPLNFQDLAIKVEKLIEHRELIKENQVLRQEINSQYDFSNIIGESPAIRRLGCRRSVAWEGPRRRPPRPARVSCRSRTRIRIPRCPPAARSA